MVSEQVLQQWVLRAFFPPILLKNMIGKERAIEMAASEIYSNSLTRNSKTLKNDPGKIKFGFSVDTFAGIRNACFFSLRLNLSGC